MSRLVSPPPAGSTCPALAPPMPRVLVVRLAALMFLGYGILGPWVPVFSQHLQELAFTPEEIGWACATNALGALLAPILWGQVADRWLAAQRCVGFCAFVCAGLLTVLAELTGPLLVFAVCLGFWFFMVPVLSLGTALTFRQLADPERDYGRVRLWGTVGWVVSALLLSLWLAVLQPLVADWVPSAPGLGDSLRLGAVFALVLGCYAWTLPHTPPLPMPTAAARPWLARLLDAPLQTFGLIRHPAFAVYSACLFGAYATIPFTTQMNPLLLRQLGIPDTYLSLTLTISQSSEILSLALLPLILARLGLKTTMVLGLCSWTTGLFVLALGGPLPLVVGSLVCHGVFITGYLVTGQVFVHRQAANDIRASAQGLIHLFSGCGLLVGNLLVGTIRDLAADNFHLAYAPAVLAAAGMIAAMALRFRPAVAVAPSK